MRESALVPSENGNDVDAAARARMIADVAQGLLRGGQKELPPTYFYDEHGSRLFDEITRLPEYYPTRAERLLLESSTAEILGMTSPRALAELGAGTASKSRVLLRELVRSGPAQYLPIDVDVVTLGTTAGELRAEFPSLEVLPIVADMRDDVAAIGARHPLLYAFLGSTIGNFDGPASHDLLCRIRATLRPTDRFLLGMDLVKDVAVIEAAYNDRAGITAAFNLNILRVLNNSLGADFDVDRFVHRAFYDVHLARIEMHLDSVGAQAVCIPGIGRVAFADGESIRTEISCKYTRESATQMLGRAGFRVIGWLTGEEPLFALALAEPSA